jgi:1-acyl-sn-glycerol-3-phosphate acyltransferase
VCEDSRPVTFAGYLMNSDKRKGGSDSIPRSNDGRNTLAVCLFAPFRMLYKLWFLLVFFVSILILYPFFKYLLAKRARYPQAFKLMRAWAGFLQWSMLAPVKVEKRAELPDPPYIVCANHSSYLDIVQMYNVIPDYFLFLGKHTLRKWPLFRMFFKDMNIAVNRLNRVEAARSLERSAQALREGTCISIFPEGTIPPSAPRLGPFKAGAFKLAIDEQVPIVPVVFLENWRIFGDPDKPHYNRGRPGIARTVIQPWVSTKGLTTEDMVDLQHRVFDLIEEALVEDADKRRPDR